MNPTSHIDPQTYYFNAVLAALLTLELSLPVIALCMPPVVRSGWASLGWCAGPLVIAATVGMFMRKVDVSARTLQIGLVGAHLLCFGAVLRISAIA